MRLWRRRRPADETQPINPMLLLGRVPAAAVPPRRRVPRAPAAITPNPAAAWTIDVERDRPVPGVGPRVRIVLRDSFGLPLSCVSFPAWDLHQVAEGNWSVRRTMHPGPCLADFHEGDERPPRILNLSPRVEHRPTEYRAAP